MRNKRKMKIIFVILGLVVVIFCFMLILCPPSKGNIPQLLDETGKVSQNSIAEKTYIDVDGDKIGAILLGEDISKPVLLVCGGGPGIPEYLLENIYGSVLSKHFVVCYFDYRGTGLSYNKNVDPNEMTTEKYLSDVDKITEYLKERFNNKKIYIMGHSFGTYIALNAVNRHPEKYVAYLAVSQITNQHESECRAYDYMIKQYTAKNNSKRISEFKKYPVHDSDEAYKKYCTSGLRDKAMHELGVGTTRDMNSVISGIFLRSLKCRAYTIKERINIWRGKINANNFVVTNEAFNFNAFKKIDTVKIPVYFFAGEYDYTCCESLQREYFNLLKAPEKQYYLYMDTAHSPIFENDEITDKYLNKIVTE